jgi:hypothetical protein
MSFREQIKSRMVGSNAGPEEADALLDALEAEATAELTAQRDLARDTAVTLEQENAQLLAERAKYVGAEPTIAEEMAYLSRCLDAVLELCDTATQAGITSGGPFTVDSVRNAAEGLGTRTTYPPAMPWAALMDDEDLHDFLGDLINALHADGPPLDVLTEVEKTCASHRVIAEAQHAHNTAPGPNADGGETA